MVSSDWGRLDNQPAMSASEMKSFINHYSNNLAKGLENDMNMVGGRPASRKKDKLKKKTPTKGGASTAYCLSCHESKIQLNSHVVRTANNRMMAKGNCVDCGTATNKFISSSGN